MLMILESVSSLHEPLEYGGDPTCIVLENDCNKLLMIQWILGAIIGSEHFEWLIDAVSSFGTHLRSGSLRDRT